METKKVKISTLKENQDNPRYITEDKFKKLVQSIIDLPQMLDIRPIVVNSDMVVLGGNMRLQACKEAGLKEVPIIIADKLTEQQQKEFIIKDNVGFGQWNWDMIANEWSENNLGEWGLDLPNAKEYKDMSAEFETTYIIEITAKDENDQEKLFNELTERGLECRVLTL